MLTNVHHSKEDWAIPLDLASENFNALATKKTRDNCFRICIQECIIRVKVVTFYLKVLIQCSQYVDTQDRIARCNLLESSIQEVIKVAAALKSKLCLYETIERKAQESSDLKGCDKILDDLRVIFEPLAEIPWASTIIDLELLSRIRLGM